MILKKAEHFLFLQLKSPNEESQLPELVCKTCLKRVKEFHDFYAEIQKNQKKLESFLEMESKSLEESERELETMEVKQEVVYVEAAEGEVVVHQELVEEYLMDESFDESPELERKEKKALVRPAKEENTICALCGATFARNKMHLHMKRFHDTKTYECSICGKVFSDAIRYGNHVRYHKTSNPCTCAVCGKMFPHEKSLKVPKSFDSFDSLSLWGKNSMLRGFFQKFGITIIK